jgi:predicted secreted protein
MCSGWRSILTVAIAAAVIATANASVFARTVIVGKETNNGSIRLNVGDTLLVRLPVNPTSDYSWFVGQNNPQVLRFAGQVTDRRVGGAGATGAQILTFRAMSSGGVGLTLSYRKPSMLGVEAADRYRLLVTVGRAGETVRTVTIDESVNNGRVEVRSGDTLVVRLASNAGAGFRWALAESSPLVRLIGERTEPGTGVRRSEITQVLLFRVGDAGRVKAGRLTLVYQRPSQPGVGARRFSVLVVAN